MLEPISERFVSIRAYPVVTQMHYLWWAERLHQRNI